MGGKVSARSGKRGILPEVNLFCKQKNGFYFHSDMGLGLII